MNPKWNAWCNIYAAHAIIIKNIAISSTEDSNCNSSCNIAFLKGISQTQQGHQLNVFVNYIYIYIGTWRLFIDIQTHKRMISPRWKVTWKYAKHSLIIDILNNNNEDISIIKQRIIWYKHENSEIVSIYDLIWRFYSWF